MRRLILLAGALTGITGWLLLAPTNASTPSARRSARLAPSQTRAPLPSLAIASAAAAPALASPSAKAPPTAADQLRGEALRRRIDDQIPSHLYGEAARCYRGGLPSDQRMDLSYHLVIRAGEVSITDAQVDSSTLSDPALARCIIERVFAFRERDQRLPDGESDGDLFIRVGGFKPFLAKVATDGDQPLK